MTAPPSHADAPHVKRIAFLPIAGPRNPYQRLQMEGLRRAGATVVHGVRGIVFAATRTQLRHRPDVLHFDWNYAYFLRRSRLLTRLWTVLYRLDIRLARMLGARLVWTLHNVRTHEPIHLDIQQHTQRWFSRQVEWIRVFDPVTIQRAVVYLDIDPDRFRVVPLGSFIGEYPDRVSREEARRHLGVPPDAFTMVNFGEMRPYKGLPTLIEFVRRTTDPLIRAIIAGRPSIPDVPAQLRELAGDDPRIILRPEFIPPDEVGMYLRAGDVIVLPFEAIDNSASAILAMSFGLAVIAPKLGALPGILREQPQLLYEPGHLEDAVARARALGAAALSELGRRNLELIRGYRWEALAPLFGSEGMAVPAADSGTSSTARWSARRLVMGTAVRAMHATGVTRWLGARRGRRGGVVSYHNVVPTEWLVPGFPHLVDHGIATFERQLDILQERFHILPAEAAPNAGDGIVLSFDDGMLNNHEIIAPILERRGLTAIFAVVAGTAAGAMPHLWRDHLYLMLLARPGVPIVLPDDGFQKAVTASAANAAPLVDRLHRWVQLERIADVGPILEEIFARNRVPFERIDWRPLRFRPMDAQQVKSLRAAGHVIASHTWSHPVLTKIDASAVRSELGRSRETLGGILGEPVKWLVYPYGTPVAVSADVARIARDTGYDLAWMNVDTGSSDPMLLPRFSMPKSPSEAEMSATISGLRSAWRHRGVAMPAAS